MKTIVKTTFIIGAFLLTCTGHAQSKKLPKVNYLTLREYDAIKINGVNGEAIPMGTIDEYYNNVADVIRKMEKLFGKNRFSITKGTEPSLYIDFSDGAIYFHFEEDPGHNYSLVNLIIRGNTWSIRIKGTTLTIGDPIGKLGKVKTLANDDGTKTVLFDCEIGEAEGWAIDFDSKDRIKEIGYTVFD